jgi:hypothetical protein
MGSTQSIKRSLGIGTTMGSGSGVLGDVTGFEGSDGIDSIDSS